MRILVCGNPLMEGDSLPIRLLPALREAFPDIEFREFDTAEELEGRELLMIDTVMGIRGVKVFDDMDSFCDSPRFSLHDYDLPLHLRLLMKVGQIEKATIIGVPSDGDESEVLEALRKEISRMV